MIDFHKGYSLIGELFEDIGEQCPPPEQFKPKNGGYHTYQSKVGKSLAKKPLSAAFYPGRSVDIFASIIDFATGERYGKRSDSDSSQPTFSPAHRKRREAELEKGRKREAERIARKQREILKSYRALPLASVGWLAGRYGITRPHGAKQCPDGAVQFALAGFEGSVPLNVQTIWPNGRKLFGSAPVAGLCARFGVGSGTWVVAEGIGNALALRESCGFRAVAAHSASNLCRIAQDVRATYPDSTILICGDNDKSGTGQQAAYEAAEAAQGFAVLPALTGDDFAKILVRGGSAAVRGMFKRWLS